jgi:hypothetical protein
LPDCVLTELLLLVCGSSDELGEAFKEYITPKPSSTAPAKHNLSPYTNSDYVYIECEPSADQDEVERLIVNDPLFLNEQTLVFPVPSIDSLEEANRGVVLERHGKPGDGSHTSFLLEARFDEARLAARIMVAAAKSLTTPRVGAYSLLDIPLSAL